MTRRQKNLREIRVASEMLSKTNNGLDKLIWPASCDNSADMEVERFMQVACSCIKAAKHALLEARTHYGRHEETKVLLHKNFPKDGLYG